VTINFFSLQTLPYLVACILTQMIPSTTQNYQKIQVWLVSHPFVKSEAYQILWTREHVTLCTTNTTPQVCSNVQVESQLQPLSGETLSHHTSNADDHARLDVSAKGFWNTSGISLR